MYWEFEITLNYKALFVILPEDYGQRAYVGKVNMDQNSPESYIEDTAQSIRDTDS